MSIKDKFIISLITAFLISFIHVCVFAECNPLYQSCGGGGGGGGGLYRVDLVTLADDIDGDGFDDNVDTCPNVSNPEQTDSDGDTVGDACDNCNGVVNPYQEDTDKDTVGDACEAGLQDDLDDDGVINQNDNCVFVHNPLRFNSSKGYSEQFDTDNDGTGDACEANTAVLYFITNQGSQYYQLAETDEIIFGDGDSDGDFVPDLIDNCKLTYNPLNIDLNNNGVGDLCE